MITVESRLFLDSVAPAIVVFDILAATFLGLPDLLFNFTEIPVKEDVMEKLNFPRILVILVHGLIGWALCGAMIWIGMAVTSMQNTLIIHAIGAPVVFWAIASIYFRVFHYTTSLQTAIAFVSVVVFMDFFVVALLIEKNFEMFASLLGTWIPWALIFASTYLTGLLAAKRAETITVT